MGENKGSEEMLVSWELCVGSQVVDWWMQVQVLGCGA